MLPKHKQPSTLTLIISKQTINMHFTNIKAINIVKKAVNKRSFFNALLAQSLQ